LVGYTVVTSPHALPLWKAEVWSC